MKRLIRSTINRAGFDVVRTTSLHGDLHAHLRNVIKAKRVDCVIDVGANRGQYGRMLRALGYGGHIVSYEPVAAVFSELEQHASTDDKWTCHQLALGETNEEKPINVYASTVFSSFLDASNYSKGIWKSLESVAPEVVQVRRLDDLFDAHIQNLGAKRIMLKLDTQGFDLQAFQGTAGRIRDVAVLQSEVSMLPVYNGMPTFLDVLPVYQSAGFHISGLYPVNRDPSMAIIEYDCVMVRPENPELAPHAQGHNLVAAPSAPPGTLLA